MNLANRLSEDVYQHLGPIYLFISISKQHQFQVAGKEKAEEEQKVNYNWHKIFQFMVLRQGIREIACRKSKTK